MFWQRLFSNVFNYFMLHVNSYFCHLFVTSHLGSSIGAYRLVKSKFGVAQFISMGTNIFYYAVNKLFWNILTEYLIGQNLIYTWGQSIQTHSQKIHHQTHDQIIFDTHTHPHTHKRMQFSQHIWFCVLGSDIQSHRTCKKAILTRDIYDHH